MTYKIIEQNDKTLLESEVNNYIRINWKPIGGICIVKRMSVDVYAQAMIKED